MSNWFKYNGRRKIIRQDRKYLEARARRLLKSYLLAEWLEKNQYYEVVAGAADACRPEMSDPNMDDAQIAEATGRRTQSCQTARTNSLRRRPKSPSDTDHGCLRNSRRCIPARCRALHNRSPDAATWDRGRSPAHDSKFIHDRAPESKTEI